MDDILVTVKKMLGLEEDYLAFDTDIIIAINSAFGTLLQLGVGPAEGFQIDGYGSAWDSFIDDEKTIGLIKEYVYLRVKLVFDLPATSFAINALQSRADELGWRILNETEYEKVTET